MQKYDVILDMSCDKLTFWPGHRQHPGAPITLPVRVNTKLYAPNLITNAAAPAELQKVCIESKKAKPAKITQPI